MSISIKYDVKGYNRVRNSLRKLASDYKETIDQTVKDWTQEQRSGLKSFGYPPQRNAPQPFKTERQRRWFFWALRTGVISVPYKRTGILASSWRATKQSWSHWVIENSASYAALVVGRDEQALYHKGHWWIAQDLIEEQTGDLTKDLTKEIIGLAKMGSV